MKEQKIILLYEKRYYSCTLMISTTFLHYFRKFMCFVHLSKLTSATKTDENTNSWQTLLTHVPYIWTEKHANFPQKQLRASCCAYTNTHICIHIYSICMTKWLLLINNFINWPLTTLWPHYQAISTSNLPQKLSDLQQILHNNFLATKADLLHTRTHIHTWLHISINFFANTPAQVDIYLWRILHPQAKEKGGKDSI